MKDILNKFRILFYNPIIVYLLLIIAISILAISSAAPITQLQFNDKIDYAMKQAVFYALGALITFIIILIGNDRIRALRWWIYGVIMVLLFGLFLKKHGVPIPMAREPLNGAVSWYNLPGIGTFQPSEFMKIAIALVVADIIQKHNELYPHLKRTIQTDLMLLLKIGASIVAPCLLIFEQPDSGITMIILFFVAIMIFTSGIKWRYIFIVGSLLTVVITIFITLVAVFPDFVTNTLGVAPYKLSRFFGWFDPFGTYQGSGYQLSQGLLAIGSGNLVGNGFQSVMTTIPEAHTDFIFAVIGMDFGLIGTSITVILCLLFDFEILSTATLNRGHYNSHLCVGIFAMLFFQQIQNIGMTVGLLPITGVTLPFISYGGSSSISYMILFGLVLSAYIEGTKIKHSEVDYYERTLYLKTKAYIKDNAKVD